MDNTVGNKNIRNDDLGIVDENIITRNGNSDILSLSSLKSSVLKQAAVADRSGNNMVLENTLQVIVAQVGENRTNGRESIVARDENSNVLGSSKLADEIGLGESTSSGAEVGGDDSVREIFGDLEKAVDDVDSTTSEVEVLFTSQ